MEIFRRFQADGHQSISKGIWSRCTDTSEPVVGYSGGYRFILTPANQLLVIGQISRFRDFWVYGVVFCWSFSVRCY
jgi:hypothetical protein